jgi:hypothetical protein
MDRFVTLIQDFLAKRIAPNEFQNQYMELWRLQRDTGKVLDSHRQAEVTEVIDDFFSYVDAYTDEPSLIGKYCNIGEEELIQYARSTLCKLLEFSL